VKVAPEDRCPGSLAVIPDHEADGAGIGRCPELDCRRLVETTACPETDGRDRWVETHKPPLRLRQDPDLAAADRIARAEAMATMAGQAG
jgi:hypothetical protein